MHKDDAMHLIESLKTYGVALIGWIIAGINWTCSAIEHVTVILIFASVVVRLICDIPKAREAIRKYWRKDCG